VLFLYLAGERAPGPDDFPTIFYQLFWTEIKSDIMWIMKDFWNGQLDMGRINYANIVLIPN